MRGKHRAMTAGLISLVAAAGAAAAADSVRLKERAIAATPGLRATGSASGTIHSDDLIGANLRNGRDETIGEIDGLLVNKAGGPVGVIVDVGGFLGLGARQIVVPLDRITIADDRLLFSTVTKQELEGTPPYVKPKSSTLR